MQTPGSLAGRFLLEAAEGLLTAAALNQPYIELYGLAHILNSDAFVGSMKPACVVASQHNRDEAVDMIGNQFELPGICAAHNQVWRDDGTVKRISNGLREDLIAF